MGHSPSKSLPDFAPSVAGAPTGVNRHIRRRKFPVFSTVVGECPNEVDGIDCEIHRLRPARSEQRRDSVPHEQLSVPDVARQHGIGGVSGLLSDLPSWDPGLGGASGEACPEAVPGVARGVEAGGNDAFSDNQRDGISR